MARSMESDLHLGQIAVRMGIIQAQDLPRLIQEARAGHVEESAGSGSAFAQLLLRKHLLSVSDYLYMADQARLEKTDEDAKIPLKQLETAFRSYESGELDLGSFEDVIHSTSGEPIRRPADVVQRFGRYELLEEVARGGMGIVYKTRDTSRDGAIVALKVMIEADDDEVRLARFEREAELCGSLDHPNIVRIFDAGRVEGMPFFTMDLVEGESLDDMLEGDGIPRDLALKAIAQTARAMHHAHERGIIHRDLKPGNILIERKTGNAKVTDFGLARDLYRGTRLTQVGQAVGTPYYMAPEQVRGERDVDGRCDIYALGVILYEVLTGDIPFDADSPLSLFRKIDREEIVLELDEELGIDERIQAIALRALAKDRDQRYHTADLFADDLERYLRGESPRAQPYPFGEALRRRLFGPGRGAALVGLGIVALVVVGLALALAVRRLRSAQARATAAQQVSSALDEARQARDRARGARGPDSARAAEEGLRALATVDALRASGGASAEGARRSFEDGEGEALSLELRRLRARARLEAVDGPEALRDAEAAVDAVVALAKRETELRLLLARALAEQGREADALRVCDALIEIDASQRGVRLERARLYMALERAPEAERELSAVLLRSPEDLEARAARVRALLAQGKLEEAGADAERVRDLAPRSLEAHLVAGEAAAARGQREDALGCYRVARELAPKDPRPLLAEAELHLAQGSWEAALATFAAVGPLGDEVSALRGEARARAFLFQLEGASEALARALAAAARLRPVRAARQRAGILVELGAVQLAADRVDDARASFEGALAADPDSTQARLWLARLGLARHDVDLARKALEPLSRARGAEALAAQSRLALLLGERDRARSLAERALAAAPAGRPAPRAQRAMALALLAGARDEAARRACHKAWDAALHDPDLAGAFLRRGREYAALRAAYGRDTVNALAEDLLGAALRLDPEAAPAHALLARLAQAERRSAPAWRALDAGLELDPFHPELVETAAALALEPGQPRQRLERALEVLDALSKSEPTVERALLEARCQAALERWAAAKESLDRAGRLAPTRAEVENLRAEILLASRSDAEVARLAEQRARELGPERELRRTKLRQQAEGLAEQDRAKARGLLDAALSLADPRDRDYPELATLKASLLDDPVEALSALAPALLQPRWDLLDRADRVLGARWRAASSDAARRALLERAEAGTTQALLCAALCAYYDALTGAESSAWFREGIAAAERCLEREPACLPAHLARAVLHVHAGDAERGLRELLQLKDVFGDSALYQLGVAEAAAATNRADLSAQSLERAERRALVDLPRRRAASPFLAR
ncbi:MAG: protein kinase [Planctomycetota bacterium]